MNIVDIICYISLIAPLVWLVWLATRSFQANASRSVLMVFGLALYGFFVNAVVVPVTNIHAAHVYAVKQMIVITGSPKSVNFGLTIQAVCLLGFSLVAVILLLLWLQRTLATVPERTPAIDTQKLAAR